MLLTGILKRLRHPGAITDPRFRIIHAPFSELCDRLAELGFGDGSVSGVLMDIGVSSPQIDDAQRGFSFRFDGSA